MGKKRAAKGAGTARKVKKPKQSRGRANQGAIAGRITDLATGKASSKRQTIIDGAFPDQDRTVEQGVIELLKANTRLVLARDKRTAAYDALKEILRSRNLREYYCYSTRKRVRLMADDPRVKVEDLREDQPTPYRGK